MSTKGTFRTKGEENRIKQTPQNLKIIGEAFTKKI